MNCITIKLFFWRIQIIHQHKRQNRTAKKLYNLAMAIDLLHFN